MKHFFRSDALRIDKDGLAMSIPLGAEALDVIVPLDPFHGPGIAQLLLQDPNTGATDVVEGEVKELERHQVYQSSNTELFTETRKVITFLFSREHTNLTAIMAENDDMELPSLPPADKKPTEVLLAIS